MGVRKGDTVVIIAGKDKGKKGKIIDVDGDRVIVEGINIIIKHAKARNTRQKSKREKKPAAIDISNVQILCKCGVATRIAHKIDDKGKKSRVCAKCGETLDKKFVKAKEKVKEAEEAELKEKDDDKTKQPLKRREVRSTAESKVKNSQNVTKQITGPRKVGSS